tara:strand:+ start:1080 stop:1433 length:354 start_codon:yes stop_codon:yes gene_type:complete
MAINDAPAFVHYQLTCDDADDVDFRWGKPGFILLDDVLTMPTVGPIVTAMQAREVDKYWVLRLDIDSDDVEDSRYGLGIPVNNDGIFEEICSAPASGKGDTPKSRYVVGSLIIQTTV